MRSKVIYVLSVVVMLIICSGAYMLSKDIKAMRIHQHLEKEWQNTERVSETAGYSTNLPIVQIDTKGQTIPGKAILDMNGTKIGLVTADDGTDTITAGFSVIDSKQGFNTLDTEADVTTYARIHYRGNSSRLFDKGSFAVKLVDENGLEDSRELAGMPSHNEWVLNGPFLDRTLIRNYLCYNIAGEIMEYAPNVRFCELFVDGEYRGVYLLVETISRSTSRLNLTKPERNKDMTSYIVRWDRVGKGDHELDNFTFYTYNADVSALDIRYPGNNLITEGKQAYIEKDISKIEKILYSYDFADTDKGYANYIDINSFADYFIINEFFRNVDAGRFSTFYYKDVRGKLKTCVWDFNNACDNYIDYLWDESDFSMQNAPWFGRLLKDKKFVNAVVYRYRHLRKTVLSDEYLQNYIDEVASWLTPARLRNYEVWGYVFNMNNYNGLTYLTPVDRNYESYDESVAQLKDFIKRRGDWLDSHIEVLYQYCHESKNINELTR